MGVIKRLNVNRRKPLLVLIIKGYSSQVIFAIRPEETE
jgi:hypothetical protein